MSPLGLRGPAPGRRIRAPLAPIRASLFSLIVSMGDSSMASGEGHGLLHLFLWPDGVGRSFSRLMMVFCMFTGDKSVLWHGNSGKRNEKNRGTRRGDSVALRFSCPLFLITSCSNFLS